MNEVQFGMSKTALPMETIEAIRAEYATLGPTALSNKLGIPTRRIIEEARKQGLRCNKKPGRIDEQVRETIRLRFVDEGPFQLAEELDLSHFTVSRVAKEMGLKSVAWKKDWIAKRHGGPKNLDVDFFDTWSAEMAYVLGFIFADGSVKSNLSAVGFDVHEQDGDIMRQIRQLTKTQAPIRIVHRKERTSASHHRLYLSSRKICRRLVELGCHPNKTYRDDPFPEVPEEFLPHFLRGAFDGDGCISRSRSGSWITCYVGSRKFVEGYHDTIRRFCDLDAKAIRPTRGEVAYTVSWAAKDDLLKIYNLLYPCGEYPRGARKLEIWGRFLASYNGEPEFMYLPY